MYPPLDENDMAGMLDRFGQQCTWVPQLMEKVKPEELRLKWNSKMEEDGVRVERQPLDARQHIRRQLERLEATLQLEAAELPGLLDQVRRAKQRVSGSAARHAPQLTFDYCRAAGPRDAQLGRELRHLLEEGAQHARGRRLPRRFGPPQRHEAGARRQ